MLKIKYMGPRAEISQHGVNYKKSREDKYVYLMVAAEILNMINHEEKHYSYEKEAKPLTEDQIHDILRHHEAQLEEKVRDEEKRYELKIQAEIEQVKNKTYLGKIEKEVWIKNLKLMKDYRIQRAVNKIYYMHCINDIKNTILRKKIEEIDMPFNERFAHVLHTLQGALETDRHPVKTKLVVETGKDDDMIVKLHIQFG
jgi:hypothetical protein